MSAARILVVEDNPEIREMIRLSLEVEGYTVLEASDGIEALGALSGAPLPDLILLDMLMPRMNGWELVEKLKQDPSAPAARIPIIAVTATSEKIHRTLTEFEGVLWKPFELDTLYETVAPFVANREPR